MDSKSAENEIVGVQLHAYEFVRIQVALMEKDGKSDTKRDIFILNVFLF